MTKSSAFGPEAFEGLEEGRAPGADHEQRAEEDHGVDAQTPAGLDPVNIGIEIEPEGELVEGERSSYAIGNGHDAAEQDR